MVFWRGARVTFQFTNCADVMKERIAPRMSKTKFSKFLRIPLKGVHGLVALWIGRFINLKY